MRIEGVAFTRKPVQNDLVLPIDAAHDLADSWTSHPLCGAGGTSVDDKNPERTKEPLSVKKRLRITPEQLSAP
jgi:hypothetical protein